MTGIRGWLETLPDEALNRILTLPMGIACSEIAHLHLGWSGCLMQVAAGNWSIESFTSPTNPNRTHSVAIRYDHLRFNWGTKHIATMIRNRVLRIQARRILSVPSYVEIM